MPIEFRCSGCDRLLRTADDKAGQSANCPSCGTELTVPAPEEPSFDVAEEQRFAPAGGTSAGGSDSTAEATKACPMCGAEIAASATKCRFCGETLAAEHPHGTPQKIDAGEVLSTSWEIYKGEMGILIGTFVLVTIMVLVVYGGSLLLTSAVISVTDTDIVGVWVVDALFIGINWTVQAFFFSGQTIVYLKVARGQNASVGDVFAGGPYFLGMLGNNILFGLAVMGGFLLLVVPGFLVMLMLWPYFYVLVDENPGGIGPLKRAAEITQGNWGHVFLLGLVAFGLGILGELACFVGLIFTAPLASLLFAVAYCRMVGHRTAADRG